MLVATDPIDTIWTYQSTESDGVDQWTADNDVW